MAGNGWAYVKPRIGWFPGFLTGMFGSQYEK